MSEQVKPQIPSTDKRRRDLVVRYVKQKTVKNDISSAMSTSMPIAAMFLRNKVLAWAALFTTLQAYLNEPSFTDTEAQPAWLSVLISVVGLLTCYMDIIMPPKSAVAAAATTAAAATASIVSETLA